jgi:hypothetical protein
MTPEEMQAQLTYLMDREAIRDVVQIYARSVDRHDADLLRQAYHEGMIDDHGAFVGDRDEFIAWTWPLQEKAFERTQHFIGNHLVEIDGETAHAETYFLWSAVNRTGTPHSTVGGRYIDRLEKRDGVWGIVARRVLTDWTLPAINTREAVESGEGKAALDYRGAREYAALATREEPRRDRDDASYERPLTIPEERIAAYRDAPVAS